jgi:hypothetical protein
VFRSSASDGCKNDNNNHQQSKTTANFKRRELTMSTCRPILINFSSNTKGKAVLELALRGVVAVRGKEKGVT